MRISDWSSDVCSSDLKTSLRAAHDAARAESGAAEVVFFDEPGFVTEGSWSNVFVERDGVLLTPPRSEEHTSELQSLMRTSYAVFCLKKKKNINTVNK